MNVSPGDLAIVVAPNDFSGATCEVVACADHMIPLTYRELVGPYWLVRFPRPMAWSNPNPGTDPREGAIPDAHLRRLKGKNATWLVSLHDAHPSTDLVKDNS